jgi:Zn-dependent protease with chaperone function
MEQPGFDSSGQGPVVVQRWPTELPLLALVILAAIVLWILLAMSLVGIGYAILIGAFLFLGHVSFVAHLRGNAVLLGPNQFPDLHRRVGELAGRAGLAKAPDAYLLQAGGALNALATKFLRSRFLVLYSDLLEACGENTRARDMIIGHELGHIKAGHLNGMWLLLPGFFVPFLGSALSRAREYTCDRYGVALCGEREGALAGLAILAAGRENGPRVNLPALAHQKEQMNTGWMTLGKWLGTHPPLCDRVSAIEPALTAGLIPSVRGPVRAVAGLAVFVLAWVVGLGVFIMKALPAFQKSIEAAKTRQAGQTGSGEKTGAKPRYTGNTDADEALAQKNMRVLADVAEEYKTKNGRYPADADELYTIWRATRPYPNPIDPFTNYRYHYEPNGDQFLLWSPGPDGRAGTEDDIHFFGGAQR